MISFKNNYWWWLVSCNESRFFFHVAFYRTGLQTWYSESFASCFYSDSPASYNNKSATRFHIGSKLVYNIVSIRWLDLKNCISCFVFLVTEFFSFFVSASSQDLDIFTGLSFRLSPNRLKPENARTDWKTSCKRQKLCRKFPRYN
jgi:hypothetical protein